MIKPSKKERLHKSLTHMATFSQWTPHGEIIKRIEKTGFQHLVGLKAVNQDNELVNFLENQYDVKDGFFLLGSEKIYFSLIDIVYIIGLPVDGRPVTGYEVKGSETCLKYLGKDGCYGSSSNVTLTWLRENFAELPDNPSKEVLDQYSRAYLLYMFGTLLFPDRSGGNISVIFLPLLENLSEVREYAWGVVVLSCLHAGLCGTKRLNTGIIPACTIVLQIFILEHYSLVAKKYLEKYFPDFNNSLPKKFPTIKEWMDLLEAPSKNNHLKIDLEAKLTGAKMDSL